MLTVAIGFLIIVLTTFIGKRFSDHYEKRERFFRDLVAFNEKLIANLSFKREDLPSVIDKYAIDSDFGNFLKNGKFANGEIKLDYPEYIKKDERVIIDDYFSNLGKQSNESEGSYLLSVKPALADLYEKSKEKAEKAKPLGVKTGFAVGVIIFIIII